MLGAEATENSEDKVVGEWSINDKKSFHLPKGKW